MKTVGSHYLDNRTMVYKNNISIIEINICGLSDHSRIAIDRYLDKCKPKVVILNGTEKSLAENTFTNFMTFSKFLTHSMLVRNGSSFARMGDLEISNINNLVISISCGGLRALVTTTYVKPVNRDEL